MSGAWVVRRCPAVLKHQVFLYLLSKQQSLVRKAVGPEESRQLFVLRGSQSEWQQWSWPEERVACLWWRWRGKGCVGKMCGRMTPTGLWPCIMSWPKSSGPEDLTVVLRAAFIIRNSDGITVERKMFTVISVVVLEMQTQCLAFIYMYYLLWTS